MSRHGRANSLIPVESFAKGGLWPDTTPDTTPALHRRVVEEPEPQVPSALHPRVDAPAKVRQKPRRSPATKRTKAPRPTEAEKAMGRAVEAVASTLRSELEPVINEAAARIVAGVVVELFGEDR